MRSLVAGREDRSHPATESPSSPVAIEGNTLDKLFSSTSPLSGAASCSSDCGRSCPPTS